MTNNTVERRSGTIAIATPGSAGTEAIVINGLCRWLELLTDDMEDTDSTLLKVLSPSGGTLYQSGTTAESTRLTVGTVFPMHGTVSLEAHAEGTQSADKTLKYDIYYTP